MMRQSLRERAARRGIACHYIDARGATVQVQDAVLERLLASMGEPDVTREQPASVGQVHPKCLVVRADGGNVRVPLREIADAQRVSWQLTLEDGAVRAGDSQPVTDAGHPPMLVLPDVPFGYHQLVLDDSRSAITLIVTPGRCWLPDHFAAGERSWGVSLQLYLLRSRRNWGIGDFTDLAEFSEQLGALDCDVVGLNPLHQMFLDAPEQASPYSPTDRQFLNVLNIDVEAVPEFRQSRAAQRLVASADYQNRLMQCRAATNVDYAAVTALKLEPLRLVYQTFLGEAAAERRTGFETFVADAGEALRRSSLFQALRSRFRDQPGHSADPATWPGEFRSVTSREVAGFAAEHAAEIGFLNWLQWTADQQLQAASERAAAAGLRIGLYRDLAVGCDAGGGELWSDPDAFLQGVLVGAPPDILNPAGQNWGLPPLNPIALADRAYAPFVKLVRANMRHAGGLRIDHVMGLQRLYCIPAGASPGDGAYVSYPVDDLIGILALESHRHRCLVVGEDLGTVPEGFRERMADANILSYRVTFFEQGEGGRYTMAGHYPTLAVAVAGSHDLPTLRSWISGSDIELRHSLRLYPSDDETQTQQAFRAAQKSALLQALMMEDPVEVGPFADAVHTFLAQTSSVLAMAQLDDLLDEAEPVNVPGTSTEHPNWRRKYSVGLEEIMDLPTVQQAVATLRTHRQRGAAPATPAESLDPGRKRVNG